MRERAARWLLVLAAVAGAVWLYGQSVADARERTVRSEYAARETARLRQQVARADTVYQHDTVTLRQWRTRYDSVRLTDTLTAYRYDTAVVYVPRADADSAVAPCTRAVQSCDIRVALRDSVIARQSAQLAAVRPVRETPVSVSLLYEPLRGEFGGWASYDLWRVRLSAGVLPGRVLVGAGVRF